MGDDDSNFHIRFIAAAANLRARNYKIAEAEDHKVKMIAGKIVPALATTTAMITGLVSAELLRLISRKPWRREEFRNGFVNLALPLWLLSEPLPPIEMKSTDFDPITQRAVIARPEGFTTWDKIEVKLGDCTLKELVDHLLNKMNMEVAILSAGNACLYNAYLPAHKKRLGAKLVAVWEEVMKHKIPPNRRCLA